MRPFWQLLRKEIRQSLPDMGFVAAAVLLNYGFLLTRDQAALQTNQLFLFLELAPAAFILPWLCWRSVAVWRRDWNSHHAYLLLSLPVSGWVIAAAKLLVITLEAALAFILMTAGFHASWVKLADIHLTPSGYGSLIAWILGSTLMATILLLTVLLLLQCAYVASRLVARLRWLVFAATVVTGWWGALRLGGLLSPLLGWLPRLPIVTMSLNNNYMERQVLVIQSAPLVGVLLVLATAFWLMARWVERDLEA